MSANSFSTRVLGDLLHFQRYNHRKIRSRNRGDPSMRRRVRSIRFLQLVMWCVFSAVLLVSVVANVAAQNGSKTKKFLTKPLVIEDQGSFFIGGVPKVTDYATVPPPGQPITPSQITIGQMYVQFEIPAKKKAKMPPVIMVHGSTHTAACLESTPDGREGWYPYFVRKGISTYLVDQA